MLVILIILAALCGGAYAAVKTTKDIGVKWTENDYQSYTQKVKRQNPMTGEFNLANLAKGSLECKGTKTLDVQLTDAEISSVLSKENGTFGPLKDVKVRFIGNNEAEATFKLSQDFSGIVDLTRYGIANNDLFKAAINGTPIYLKARVDKVSSKSISADIQNVSIGRIPLSGDLVQKIENEAVPMVNRIFEKYQNISIDELGFDPGSLRFRGTVPEEVKVKN